MYKSTCLQFMGPICTSDVSLTQHSEINPEGVLGMISGTGDQNAFSSVQCNSYSISPATNTACFTHKYI